MDYRKQQHAGQTLKNDPIRTALLGRQGAQGQENAIHKRQVTKMNENFRQEHNQHGYHKVKLRIPYETSFGQSLSVVGSIPELGDWSTYKHELQWTEGHVWLSKQPLTTTQRFFSYKYVVLDHGKVQMWEKGVDRIADLATLCHGPTGELVLEDSWQHYELRFELDGFRASGHARIFVNVVAPMSFRLELLQEDTLYVGSKTMENTRGDANGQWKSTEAGTVRYYYSFEQQGQVTYEGRHGAPVHREVSFGNPREYTG